jgi:hypothetical protein
VPDLTFIRSTRCESHACLEVAFARSSRCDHAHCLEVGATPGQVYVRDSKDLAIPPLSFTPEAWRSFVAGIKAGDL